MGKGKIVGIIVAIVAAACIVGGAYYLNTNKATKNNEISQSNNIQASKPDVLTNTQEADKSEVKKDDSSQKTDVKKDDSNQTIDVKKDNSDQKTDVKKDNNDQKADVSTNTGSSNIKLPVGATISEIVPNGNIINSAKSYAVPANEVNQMIAGKYKGNEKMVFLTFDDGPSVTNTPKILNILKQYGVHGTFFVLGSELKSESAKNIVKDEIMNGNAIADHSYTHNYKILYPNNSVNVSTFMNEFNETNNIMKSVLGKNFNARIVRMPGGYMSRAYYHDKNLPALNAAFSKAGIESIDWTAESGDAEPQNYSVSQLVQNAIDQSKGYNHVVLLMHDIKPKTTQALPQIIEYYKSHGYEFKVISNTGIN